MKVYLFKNNYKGVILKEVCKESQDKQDRDKISCVYPWYIYVSIIEVETS